MAYLHRVMDCNYCGYVMVLAGFSAKGYRGDNMTLIAANGKCPIALHKGAVPHARRRHGPEVN